jgi:prepilin-type N-terminal cleavage/methylation domain-containing protein
MKKGFTLLELIMVIVILGILSTLGFTQYTKMVEKGRTAEARTILGQIRSAQIAYYQEWGVYGGAISNLFVDAPTTCMTTHYFMYATTGPCTAVRCTAGGKIPPSIILYSIALSVDGIWSGTGGYY